MLCRKDRRGGVADVVSGRLFGKDFGFFCESVNPFTKLAKLVFLFFEQQERRLYHCLPVKPDTFKDGRDPLIQFSCMKGNSCDASLRLTLPFM